MTTLSTCMMNTFARSMKLSILSKRLDLIFFFFSSRRRHTRLQGDWSSDVCSSDLTPGRPEGRGKIERLFETVRGQFLVEVTGTDEPGRHQVADLGELNRLFTAWVETVYHRTTHSETGQAPIERWQAGGPFPLPTPAALREAFLWS